MQSYKKSIIVAGSGRSGTTWLGNIIAGDEFRILFEPFDYRHVPDVIGLGLRPYFNPYRDYPKWRDFIEKVLSGSIENEWIDQDIKRLDPLKMSGILVKEIRINALLAWLYKNFHCRIVYIIRHPCAVIVSRIQSKWETHIDAFLAQPELMEDHLVPYEGIMRQAKTDVQKHAVMWCVENLIPLRQMKDYSWLFCRYEDLVADGEHEVSRLLQWLGLDLNEARIRALREISRTHWKLENTTKDDLINEWNAVLSDGEKNDIVNIVNTFGITCYAMEQVMPLRKY